jgi:hypothetical protein
VRLGDPLELLRQGERIGRTVALVGADRHLLALVDAGAHLQAVHDEEVARFALGRPPGLQLALGMVRPDGGGAAQDGRAIRLDRFDPGGGRAGGGQRRLHLLALDHHGSEVAADAAPLEPRVAPHRHGQGVELAEVGGSFDRGADEPERRGLPGVVHAGMALDDLVLEHLGRRAEGPGQRDLGGEAHRGRT